MAAIDPGTSGSPQQCVIGVDAGASNLRALVATRDGAVLARTSGPGANVFSSGPKAIDNLVTAVRAAVAQADLPPAGRIEQVYIAAAGGLATERQLQAQATDQLRASGLEAPITWASDVTVVFPGATTQGDGLVVAVGTGSVFTRVQDFAPTATIGGHGWLIGDEGSAVSIGIAAVRHAFAVLDGIASSGALFGRIVEALALEPDAVTGRAGTGLLTAAVYGRNPAELGVLAPVVVDTIADDPVAQSIANEAVDGIIGCLAHLAPADDLIVAAGSIAAGPHPLAEMIRTSIALRWPDATLVAGSDGAVGAAFGAIIERYGTIAAGAHERLLAHTQLSPEPVASASPIVTATKSEAHSDSQKD